MKLCAVRTTVPEPVLVMLAPLMFSMTRPTVRVLEPLMFQMPSWARSTPASIDWAASVPESSMRVMLPPPIKRGRLEDEQKMLKAVVVLMVREFTVAADENSMLWPEAKPLAKVTSLLELGMAAGFQLAVSNQPATSFAKAVPPPSQVKAAA